MIAIAVHLLSLSKETFTASGLKGFVFSIYTSDEKSQL